MTRIVNVAKVLSTALASQSLFFAVALAQSSPTLPPPNVRPAIKSKPVPLDWRAIRWPSLDFGRQAIEGGAALYTLPSSAGKKMRIDLVFETGVYSLPRDKRPAVGAAVDLFLQGGAGKRSFEELQQYFLETGIVAATRLSPEGFFQVTVEGLSEDFGVALGVLEDILLRPRFDKNALDLWKQERIDEFQSLLDASNSRKQGRFIERETIRLAFGDDHYFAQSLDRISKKAIEPIANDDVRALSKKLISRTGLNAVLSGSFNSANRDSLQKLLAKIPRQHPMSFAWLPERLKNPPSQRVRTAVIQKEDMSQAAVSLRYYLPGVGKLNTLERTHWSILREVFSSSGGVVGNDRFSKAMRADSGISYSPNALFDPESIDPNTNVGAMRMNFQSPNERIAESVGLARRTWTDFATKGITPEEFENARISRMNTMLAGEQTIFDKADEFIDDLRAKMLPSSIGIETSLVRLEQERDPAAVNGTLQSTMKAGYVPVLVIMGNIGKGELDALRALPDVELVKVIKFTDLIKEF